MSNLLIKHRESLKHIKNPLKCKSDPKVVETLGNNIISKSFSLTEYV